MAFNISEFRSRMVGDGARPNLFEVRLLGLPEAFGDSIQNFTFLCKTAEIPGASIGQAPVQYFGREIKLAGNRTFGDWTVSVINDENFDIRNSLEQWMGSINSHLGNLRQANRVNPGFGGYQSDAIVYQYGKTGNVIAGYQFVGLFPVDISPISLDWGSNDTIEEFSVTFAYQWWQHVSGDNLPTFTFT